MSTLFGFHALHQREVLAKTRYPDSNFAEPVAGEAERGTGLESRGKLNANPPVKTNLTEIGWSTPYRNRCEMVGSINDKNLNCEIET